MFNFENQDEEKKADKKSELWEKSQSSKLIQDLKKGVDLQKTMESLPNFNEAFMPLDVIVCSDGRVLPLAGAKLGLAGEGILLNQEELDKFIKQYRGKIKKVTSHEDCGAANKAFKEQKIMTGTADGLGMDFAKWLAKQLGATYEHLTMQEMRSDFHNERAICFDGTGKFNPAILSEMPGHFVCSGYGFGLSEEYMQAELETLAGIALGNHGFGNKFTAEDPFYIIISAKDDAQLKTMELVAKKVADKFENRVKVRGFISSFLTKQEEEN